jgi:Ca2+-binding RTX toxin-like protein
VLGAVSFAGIAAASGYAPDKSVIPSCFGKRATIVVTKNGAHIWGTPGNDVIVVTAPKGAWVDGGAGNDLICGGSGPDHLIGGPGNDHLDGRGGVNVLDGGGGRDWITSRGDDEVVAAKGDLVNGQAPSPSASAQAPVMLLPAFDLLSAPPSPAEEVPAPVVAGPEVAAAPGAVAVAAAPATSSCAPADTPTTYPNGQGTWAPAPPAANAPTVRLVLPSTAVPMGTVRVGAVVAAPGTKVTSWTVDFGDGSVRTRTGPVPAQLAHVYKQAGVYPVTLRVAAGHATAETTTTLQVQGDATTALVSPQPQAGAQVVNVDRDDPTLIDATGSFPGSGQVLATGSIDFGDCSAALPLTGDPASWMATHTYVTDGPKTVTVTVTDGAGVTTTATTSLDIVDPPAPVTQTSSAATTSVAPGVAPSGAPTTGDFGTPSVPATAPVVPVAPTPTLDATWSQ